ncbi:hypothetical protein KAFR_0K02580 [Kazachstania africana CBS 2517]|uniref:Glycosyltransferase family 32 protein n=1 Tax=Kazachstania africana (strain ATCC 22294 / BCRC 22015 / CBS 2517 / CECT 1963 / NBRC 1671 / NRRL Y-8276) TaxID=1071382 RepID=H2B1W4_KAZAF|nr:hypothetical protein KAFR_0K02580 [Kazachstania africana CBS 2517]CCF60614.1 hypothetical protein KAFR_0K02580 [Kazachstania africana CBS 2517]
MAKVSRGFWNPKRLVWFILCSIVAIIFVVRFFNNSDSTNLQNILQNLPKEISQSINNAASRQNSDLDILAEFERLAEEIALKQDYQMQQMEKQRRLIEKKIKELKPLPSDLTLREKLAFTFEYEPKRKFPAFIWQTWKLDANPRDTLLNKENWDEKNPGFVHEILNDDIMHAFVRHYYSTIPEVIEAYNVLPSLVLKIDFFKYLILLARGGVFADMDTVPLRPIPNWIPEDMNPNDIGLIVGVEHDAEHGSNNWKNKYIRRLQFGNWVIQAKPGHPVIREIVAHITEETIQRMLEGQLKVNIRNDLSIMSWTGTGIWTDVIFTYLNDYMKSGLLEKITWMHFHKLTKPRLLSDILVFPEFSFNAPYTIENDDLHKEMYFTTHESTKFWKAAPKVAK